MKSSKNQRRSDEIRASVAALIWHVVRIDDHSVMTKHKLDVLSTLLWKFTEADGKHNTRYYSVNARKCISKNDLRHDHVFTRSALSRQLLDASTMEQVNSVLENAVACVVTIEEHAKLTVQDRFLEGWDRYRKAGIEWKDLRPSDRADAKACPECGRRFQGQGWEGIDAHWRSFHESIMPYREAWPLIEAGDYRKQG